MIQEYVYKTWDEAFKHGYRIVIKANRLGDDTEEEIELGRLAAKALLMGSDPQVIEDLFSVGCEANLVGFIIRNTH